MRALSLRAPRDPAVIDAPVPAPAPDEVLVRVSACGVCASDLNAWRGVPGIEYPLSPGAPGHEVIGTVLRQGAGVRAPRIGEVVTGLMWNGFAEFAVARAEHLVSVPPDTGEVLGEPLACAWNVVRRAALQPGDEVALVGFGYLAALIVQFLPASVPAWTVVTRRPASRDLARALGASAAYDFDTVPGDAWDRFPVVIESAGVQQSLDFATWLTAYGGRLVIAGYHADGPRTVNMQSWNWKGIDVINAHERQPAVSMRALGAAFEQLAGRAEAIRQLHTHCFSLEHAANAFETAERRPSGFVKGLLRP